MSEQSCPFCGGERDAHKVGCYVRVLTTWSSTDAELATAWASRTGPAAAPISILAADHSGMRVDYRGMLRQAREALRRSPGQAEMLRQLEGHLEELGRRWYAGDIAVVDELLQLYCVERGAREARKAQGANATGAEHALLDACRTAALALAHASRESAVYNDAYMAVSKAIDAASAGNQEARDAG